jgi:protein-disulfide isomerase
MTIDRRNAVLGLLAAGGLWRAGAAPAAAQATDQWFDITGDDGRPVSNMRLPVELTSEIEELAGAVWVGSSATHLTLVEFFDYNCPFCRRAAKDIHALMQRSPELRVGLVNNPILSPRSEQAARIELALLAMKGPAAAYAFHRGLFERRGPIDAQKALEVADELGVPRAELEARAQESRVADTLEAQMTLAASLGFSATPSFSVAGAGVFGYPGVAALDRIVESVELCGEIRC